MIPSLRANHIQEYFFSSKLKEIGALMEAGQDIINLGIGSPDLAPDVSVLNTLSEALVEDNAFSYQAYKGLSECHEAIRKWYEHNYKVELSDQEEIILTHGSKEGLHFLMLAYLENGNEVLIPNPGYPAYSSAAKLAGGVPVTYTLTERNGWHPEIAELERLLTPKTRLLVINYPHMPTGTPADRNRIEEIVNWAKHHEVLICHDNPYSNTLCTDPFSLFQIPGALDSGIELNSLSKSASMAGARVGMVIGRADLVQPIGKIQSSFSSGMFRPIQLAVVTALEHFKEYQNKTNRIYAERKLLAMELMNRLNCQYDKHSEGMFLWAKVPEQIQDGEALSDALLYGAQVFITPGSVFGSQGRQYVRMSLCQSEECILESIKRIEQLHI